MGKVGFITRGVPKLIDPLPGGRHLIDGIEYVVSWARANSLWPLVYGTACCAMEMMACGASRHDWARFGVEVARATPRQADLIIIAGTLVEKMAKPLATLYEQMPGPKYVIAMGSCAISGGPFFYDSYSVIKGGDRIIPVDVYIPGCPPRPEALLYGIMELQKMIRTEGRRNPWKVKDTNNTPSIDLYAETKNNWAAEEQKRQENGQAAPKVKPERPKPVRLVKPKFPQIDYQSNKRAGLDQKEIMALVRASFPSAGTFAPEETDTAEKPAGIARQSVNVETKDYLALLDFLKNHQTLEMNMLVQITAVDQVDRFEVVVQLQSARHGHMIFVHIPVDRNNPNIPTITSLFCGAEWHEREIYDFFGITFTGHPDLRRLFLNDDFPGHPLRKDFSDATRVIPRPY